MPLNKAVTKMGLDEMGGCLAQRRSEKTREKKMNPPPGDPIDLKAALANRGKGADVSQGQQHQHRPLALCLFDPGWFGLSWEALTCHAAFQPRRFPSKTVPWTSPKEQRAPSPSLVLQSLVDAGQG